MNHFRTLYTNNHHEKPFMVFLIPSHVLNIYSMFSVLNFMNPMTSGSLRLSKAGREPYRTVVCADNSKKTEYKSADSFMIKIQ